MTSNNVLYLIVVLAGRCRASSITTTSLVLIPLTTMVRLITHNLLACHAKGCTSNNFPLLFQDVAVELRDADFNADFLRGFLPRLEWPALVGAARQVRPPPS